MTIQYEEFIKSFVAIQIEGSWYWREEGGEKQYRAHMRSDGSIVLDECLVQEEIIPLAS